MDALLDAACDASSSPSTLDALRVALRNSDDDAVCGLVMEHFDCHQAMLTLFAEGMVTMFDGPTRWSLLRHLDVASRPLAALDALACDFKEYILDENLLIVAHNVLRVANRPTDNGGVRFLIFMAVCRNVLALLHGIDVASEANAAGDTHALRSFILFNRLWRHHMFRVAHGVDRLVLWCAHITDALTEPIVRGMLVDCSEHVVASPSFPELVVTAVALTPPGLGSPLVTALFFSVPTAALVMAARECKDGSFDEVFLPCLKHHLPDDAWTYVAWHWRERIDAVAFAIDTHTNPPYTYECPITLSPVVHPCIASDGHTYEQDAIMRVLVDDLPSPMTRAPLDLQLVYNYGLRRMMTA